MTYRQLDRQLADRFRAGETLETLAESSSLPVRVVQLCIEAATRRWSATRPQRQMIWNRFATGDSLQAIAVGLDLTVPIVEQLLRTEVRARSSAAHIHDSQQEEDDP